MPSTLPVCDVCKHSCSGYKTQTRLQKLEAHYVSSPECRPAKLFLFNWRSAVPAAAPVTPAPTPAVVANLPGSSTTPATKRKADVPPQGQAPPAKTPCPAAPVLTLDDAIAILESPDVTRAQMLDLFAVLLAMAAGACVSSSAAQAEIPDRHALDAAAGTDARFKAGLQELVEIAKRNREDHMQH